MGENDNNDNNKNKKPGGLNSTIIMLIIAVILTLIFWIQFNNYRSKGETEVEYSKFINMVQNHEVGSVKVYNDKIYFEPKMEDTATENVVYYVVRLSDYELVDRLAESGVEFKAIDEGGNAFFREILSWIIMIGAFYLIMMLFMRSMSKSGGGIMGVGKSGAKMYGMEKETGITFADVAGEEEAKESLTEMVDFLKEPKRYLEIGAKLPRGALLVGPPGTGKTLLAKAVAGEAGVPFFSMSGSEFVEMYVGVGASRVRDLFKQATLKAPCIIFIDEIDAIGRSRDTRHMGGDSEREQTLNQLLSEMDGFDTEKGIIVLAATNRPEVLDKALLRPGRFDRRVIVEKPDLKGREDILKVHSKNVKLDETVDLHELAFATSGSAGADLANIINEAALMAVRKGRKLVSQNDLLESVEVVFAGKEKKDRILSAEEKSIVAYHESGHALLTVLQKHTMPVQKITIVPRTGGALGYVWQTPEEERYLQTKTEMEAHIVIAMGGRAAEAIKFPSVTTGASNDIEQATREARAMVTMYGMSDKFGMVQLEAITGEYLDRRAVMQCSDETATKIDTEVKNIVNAAYEKAYKILKDNEHVLDAIATYLIDHETISGKEFMQIFNQVTGSTLEVKMNEKGEVITDSSMFVSGFDVDLEKAASEKEAKKAADKAAEKEAKKKKKKEKKEAEKKEADKKKFKVYKSAEAAPSEPFVPSGSSFTAEGNTSKAEEEDDMFSENEDSSPENEVPEGEEENNLPWN